jgi:hypothetical protein
MLNIAVLYLYFFAGELRGLVADDRGQSETTEMLIRISLALAIIFAVGAVLYVAITQLGNDVAGDIGGASWGG